MKTIYDNKNICCKCGGRNSVKVKDQINHDICECETECEKCHHKDYWACGWFESRTDHLIIKQ